MASAQVVETSVNTNNSPSQDYTTRDITRECILSVLEIFKATQKDDLDHDLSSLSYYDYWLVSADKFN